MSDYYIVTNMNFNPILEAHIAKNADITVVCNKGMYSMEQTRFSTVVAVSEDNRVYDVIINPQLSGMCNISLNMFIVKKDFLIELVQQAMSRSQYSFERDVMQAKVKELKVYAYNYDNYFSRIDGINSFFKANMDLLNFGNTVNLFPQKMPIYTKVSDNAPCKYGIGSSVKNSLIADGSVIEGEVENCIIFRGVKVGKGAIVRNSIIMQDTIIGKKSNINYIITDKKVTIGEYRTLSGSQSYPLFVGKGANL